MIRVKSKDRIAHIEIGGSESVNLITVEALHQLHEYIDTICNNPEIRVLIFSGKEGNGFVAGADLDELKTFDPSHADKFSLLGQSLFQKIENMDCLSIAAVDGHCMGGGLDLLLSCDLRIASFDSVFAHPGIKIGIITGFGGTVRLPKETTNAKAKDLLFSGRKFSAREALEYGIVNELCNSEEVMDRCFDYAMKFAPKSGDSARAWKKSLLAGYNLR